MKTLSPRQQSILYFLQDFVERKGYPPSIREIVQGCYISSTSVVDYNLKALESEGYLRRDPEVSRGIELLVERQRHWLEVPLIGYIAAGEPIPVPSAEVWNSSPMETVALPQDFIRGKEKAYALRVKGNSMVDALINDGDIVLMQQVSTADDGTMVAIWLKAEREVTLKKLYREQDRLRLQPANSQMQPLYVHPDNVDIQGKVIGVLRQLG